MNHLKTTRPFQGFTLVELLVVLSIISLLISILLPALGRARQSARNLVCMNNLKQIGVALATYGAENKNVVYPANRWNYTYWQTGLDSYLGGRGRNIHWHAVTSRAWACPVRVPDDYAKLASGNYNMTAEYNTYVGSSPLIDSATAPHGVGMRHELIKKPSNKLHVMELSVSTSPATHVQYSTYGYYGRRFFGHNDAANFLFVDGHVLAANESHPMTSNVPATALPWWYPDK